MSKLATTCESPFESWFRLFAFAASMTLAFAGLAFAAQAADPPTPGSLLVSNGRCCYTDFFSEYQRDGTEVRRVPIEPAPAWSSPHSAQDLVVDDAGRVVVVNGIGWVFLSTWDPGSETWSHAAPDQWKQPSIATLGGIAVLGDRVFATDAWDYGSEPKWGILVYDRAADSWQRIAEDISPCDLNLGLDGLLYALHRSSPPGGEFVDVYDPRTLTFLRRIDLAAAIGWPIDNRAIAADRNGDLFIGTWNGLLHRVDASGELVASVAPECPGESTGICHVSDIDISATGELVFTTKGNDVLFTDTAFSYFEGFRVYGNERIFATWVPHPKVAVEIDFKPGSDANLIALTGEGKVWVALFGNEEVEVEEVVREFLALGPAGAPPVGPVIPAVDLDRDGWPDLLVAFQKSELGLGAGATEICLAGTTAGGVPFEGCDAVHVLGACGRGAQLAWIALPVAFWSRRKRRGTAPPGSSRRAP